MAQKPRRVALEDDGNLALCNSPSSSGISRSYTQLPKAAYSWRDERPGRTKPETTAFDSSPSLQQSNVNVSNAVNASLQTPFQCDGGNSTVATQGLHFDNEDEGQGAAKSCFTNMEVPSLQPFHGDTLGISTQQLEIVNSWDEAESLASSSASSVPTLAAVAGVRSSSSGTSGLLIPPIIGQSINQDEVDVALSRATALAASLAASRARRDARSFRRRLERRAGVAGDFPIQATTAVSTPREVGTAIMNITLPPPVPLPPMIEAHLAEEGTIPGCFVPDGELDHSEREENAVPDPPAPDAETPWKKCLAPCASAARVCVSNVLWERLEWCAATRVVYAYVAATILVVAISLAFIIAALVREKRATS